MEILNLDELDIIQDAPSGGFGNGIELLMNTDKKRSNSVSSFHSENKYSGNVNINDLNSLETELNGMTTEKTINTGSKGNMFDTMTNMFGFSSGGNDSYENQNSSSNLGYATKETTNSLAKTWDGFSKLTSDIPQNKPQSAYSANLPEREKLRKKRMMLKRLEDWYAKKQIKTLPNNESSYEEIEDEYETAIEERNRTNGLNLYRNWFKTFVGAIEYGNKELDPFSIDLTGLSDTVDEDLDSYEEVFGELYEKYKGIKMPPELSLCMKLGFTLSTTAFTNRMFSQFAPGVQDVIRQNPQMMKTFTDATEQAMKSHNPGFAMASNLLNRPEQSPLPAPIETKPQRSMSQMQFQNTPLRPDISVARGVDLPTSTSGMSYTSTNAPVPAPAPVQRAEMKGPSSDIDSLLAGLKTKPMSSYQPLQQQQQQSDSYVSASSIRDLQNTRLPKKTRKPQNRSISAMSDGISLDL